MDRAAHALRARLARARQLLVDAAAQLAAASHELANLRQLGGAVPAERAAGDAWADAVPVLEGLPPMPRRDDFVGDDGEGRADYHDALAACLAAHEARLREYQQVRPAVAARWQPVAPALRPLMRCCCRPPPHAADSGAARSCARSSGCGCACGTLIGWRARARRWSSTARAWNP